jgi:dipeptidyl-peptidase-4
MDRRQRYAQTLRVDPATGATAVVREDRDDVWLELVVGLPAWLPDGRLLHAVDSEDTRRLAIDGRAVTPPGVQLSHVIDVGDDGVLFSATDEPTEDHLWSLALDGTLTRLTEGAGVHSGRRGAATVVVSRSSLDRAGAEVTVHRPGTPPRVVASSAQAPGLIPRVTLLHAGDRALRTALLLPSGYAPESGRLPVLLDPYGGPHARRVVAARNAYLTSQWFADQGFAVVVADGRGTPARGPAWERSIAGSRLPAAVLDDQVDALHAVAAKHPDTLDLDRVAIRGWSFGGYLAALGVLRRPDVFAAAVVGAPVTDWTLYDTFYTERYLGLPDEAPEAYAATSLLEDAAALERPMLLVHGLADDNVVAAHSLRLSSALLAAGRPHTFLPLSGVTHMTPQEVVAENLLLLQVRFLRDALRMA